MRMRIARIVGVALLMVSLGARLARADLVWFNDPNDFEAFMLAQGCTLEATETFEESTLPPNSSACVDDPLQSGVPNGPFPNGLELTYRTSDGLF